MLFALKCGGRGIASRLWPDTLVPETGVLGVRGPQDRRGGAAFSHQQDSFHNSVTTEKCAMRAGSLRNFPPQAGDFQSRSKWICSYEYSQ